MLYLNLSQASSFRQGEATGRDLVTNRPRSAQASLHTRSYPAGGGASDESAVGILPHASLVNLCVSVPWRFGQLADAHVLFLGGRSRDSDDHNWLAEITCEI